MPARAHAGLRGRNGRRGGRAAFQPRAGGATGASLTVSAGSAANLLPEVGGPGATAAAHREHVPRQSALLGAPTLRIALHDPRGPFPAFVTRLLLSLEPTLLFL